MTRRYLIGSLLAIIVIYALAVSVEIQGMAGLLRGVSLRILAACCGIYLISHTFRALRFRAVLGESAPGFPAMLAVVSIHNLLNQVMPVRSGESVYPVLVRKFAGIGYAQGISSLLLVRVYDLAAFFGVLGLFLLDGLLKRSGYLYVRYAAVCVGILIIAAAFRFMGRIAMFISGIAGNLIDRFGLARLLRVEGQGLTARIQEGFGALNAAGRYNYIALCSVCVWLSTFVMFHLFAWSVGGEMSFSSSVIGSSGAVLTGLLPVNTFGSIGTLEGGWTLGFVAVGLGKESALASGVLMHAFVIVYGFLLSLTGAYYLKKNSPAAGSEN